MITLDDELEMTLSEEARVRSESLADYIQARIALDGLNGVEFTPDSTSPQLPTVLTFEELHKRVLTSLREVFQQSEIQSRIRAVAPYASFEQWMNLEMFYGLQRTLMENGLTVRPERPYDDNNRRRSDVAVLATGLGETWGAYRIETKQIWNEGNYSKQTVLARLDAQRVAAAGGGLLVLMIASNVDRETAVQRRELVESQLNGWIQLPGDDLLDPADSAPCVLITAYRVSEESLAPT